MVAPEVVEVMVTVCAGPKDPPLGEKVGAATAPLMVNVPVATPESTYRDFIAIALSVVVLETVIAAEYSVDAAVGVVPLVV